MLYVLDPRTDSLSELRLATPRLLRIRAVVPATTTSPALTAIRVALVADLLARVAEMRGMQALTIYAGRDDPTGQKEFAAAAAGFGIHPPAAWHHPAGPGAPDSAADVVVTADGSPADAAARTVAGPGPAPDQAGPPSALLAVGAVTGQAATASVIGTDPLAVRLALLSVRHDKPADLGPEVTSGAARELASWRRLVADWAESPSCRIPDAARTRLLAAFGRLDLVSALAALRELARTEGLAPGARFETFAYADRVLGLDLAREVGQARI